MLPMVVTTSAKSAGYRHVRSRMARTVSAISHGSAANGRRIAEMRAASDST